MLNLHKANVLANLTDFQTLTVDVVEKKTKVLLRHREHGHEANIIHSLEGAAENGGSGEDINYVAATATFFLAIRQAIDSGETVIVSWPDIAGTPA